MYDSLISSASAKWSVPPEWIKAVIQVESAWNPEAYNPDDPSFGLMGILDATARAYGVTDLITLFDPATNIDIGTHLLADLRARYGDDFRSVYSAYNSGSPTLWETSAEVAGNVQRAVSALAEYLGTQVSGNAGTLVLIGLGVWWFVKKRRKR